MSNQALDSRLSLIVDLVDDKQHVAVLNHINVLFGLHREDDVDVQWQWCAAASLGLATILWLFVVVRLHCVRRVWGVWAFWHERRWRAQPQVTDKGRVARGVVSRNSWPFTRPIGRAFRVSVWIVLLGLAVYSHLLPQPYTVHFLGASPSYRDPATIQPLTFTPPLFAISTWRVEDDSM